MTRAAVAALAAVLCAGGIAAAQDTPFDMTPERGDSDGGLPSAQPPAAPFAPGRPAAPQEPADERTPPPPPDAASPAPKAGGEGPAPDTNAPPEAEKWTAEDTFRRPLLPVPDFTLDGENPSRSFALHLTAEQAASAARLHYGYQNAVMVAPENSRLRIRLNGVSVVDEPVQSADGIRLRVAAVPSGILRAGRNEVSIAADQRHRTDCTVESTYELWSTLDPTQTALGFANPAASVLRTADDLRALSPNADGKTSIRIVAPSLATTDVSADMVALAQAIALHAPLPALEFNVGTQLREAPAALTVLVGTFDEIRALGGGNIAGDGPMAQFAPGEPGSAPVFLIAGKTREEWRSAIAGLRRAVDRPPGVQRDVLKAESWRAPDAPMLYGARRLTFAELGLRSQEFSGRRFHTEFQFAVPSDFYAEAYGQASILLDAAYSAEVEPGSLINVHVNGNIAASVPISNTGGGFVAKEPIKVSMRHFRPGLNLIGIDAELRTVADAVCAPGSIATQKPRFALFDTSQFVLPQFGRIAQRPNLAAFGGTAFPYGFDSTPVSVVASRGDLDALSAAATVFARMAISASRVIDTEFVSVLEPARARNAVILGPVNQISETALQQVGIDPASRTGWAARSTVAAGETVSPDQWRQEVQGTWIRRSLRGIQTWMSQTFNITDDMLRFVPGADEVFSPPPSATLVVSQNSNPAGTGVWTVMTSPSAELLRESVAAVAVQTTWLDLAGHLTAFDLRTGQVMSRPVNSFDLVETQPRTFANARLVIANWLSANILSYALILVVVCLVLGISTNMLLSRLGSRK